jgi:hypothetical protein
MLTFPQVRIGDPIRHESLTVFPLFAEANGAVDYLLADEAIQTGTVTVQEVSEGGSVPDLLVENGGDSRVLFLEGEELVGAKQNRVLNTSLLLPAKSKVKIPVSCVERGRWAYHSRHFGSAGHHSPSRLRHTLKSAVSESLASGGGHTSDQGKVWEEVDRQQTMLGVTSQTSSMSDTYVAYQKQIDDYADQFPYAEGATGLAVAVGDKVVAVDLFDKPATCHKVWRRLLTGYTLDAVAATAAAEPVTAPAVEGALGALRDSSWEKVPAVGEGEEYRVKSDHAEASALAFGDALVHGSLLTGP